MNTRSQVLLWGAQRASAMLLAVCVLVHLITIIYAVRHGLSAAEILGRTRGSVAWGLFYATFVAAVAVHAPIFIGLSMYRSLWRFASIRDLRRIVMAAVTGAVIIAAVATMLTLPPLRSVQVLAPVLLIVIMGLVVLAIVMAILLPIFQISQLAR